MSKIKLGFSALIMLVMMGMFAAMASAATFTPSPSNPAPGINVGTIDNFGNVNAHKTHGNFQNNTNSCANCHSTHNGKNAQLVKFQNSEPDMCLSCHDGTMGFYNVNEASGAGIFNSTHDSASMHQVGTGQTVGSAPGAIANKSTAELECSSCHNPHGSVNDRLLKETVVGTTTFAGQVAGTKVVTLDLTPDPAFADINNSSTMSGLKITKSNGPNTASLINYSKFCSACHDSYLQGSGTLRTDGAHYTHTTNSSSAGRNCASCHFAHGTDITLLKDTQGLTIADYVKPVAEGGKGWSQATADAYMKDISAKGSSLKKYTNMAVCWSCHISSHKLDTQQPDPKFTYPGLDREGKPVNMFPGRPAK
jgi:predicted CXXCH cytochrome family protein